jgi:catechol 2,3-dioxygenase-like lactoylglutathione lyase family enzyme
MIPARELRFSFVVDDYEAALHLFRDVFGVEVLEEFDETGKGALMAVPEATLELVDVEHGRMVDDIEVGRHVDERVRIAVKVDDLQAAGLAVTEAWGEAMAQPVITPWGDTNQRFRLQEGMQITLFEAP